MIISLCIYRYVFVCDAKKYNKFSSYMKMLHLRWDYVCIVYVYASSATFNIFFYMIMIMKGTITFHNISNGCTWENKWKTFWLLSLKIREKCVCIFEIYRKIRRKDIWSIKIFFKKCINFQIDRKVATIYILDVHL